MTKHITKNKDKKIHGYSVRVRKVIVYLNTSVQLHTQINIYSMFQDDDNEVQL